MNYVALTVWHQEIGHWEEGEANMEKEEAKPCVEIILWIRSATWLTTHDREIVVSISQLLHCSY